MILFHFNLVELLLVFSLFLGLILINIQPLTMEVVRSIWDTPGRSLREPNDNFGWFILLGLLLTIGMVWTITKPPTEISDQDPTQLIQKAIRLSKEGADLINLSLLMVTSVTVNNSYASSTEIVYSELDNLIYDQQAFPINDDNAVVDQISTNAQPVVNLITTTVSRFGYLNEMLNFISTHPWLTSLTGVSILGFSAGYLYVRYNSRKKFKSLVKRPINLFFWIAGVISLGGASYLCYKGYDDFLSFKRYYGYYQNTKLISSELKKIIDLVPPPIDEMFGFLLFFRKKTIPILHYFFLLLGCVVFYILNFLNQSYFITRYSESARLSTEIHQKTIKLHKLAQIEQKDLNSFVESIEQTTDKSLIKLAQDYSIQNKYTTEAVCRVAQKISQADNQMLEACQVIKKNSFSEVNLGQRQLTFEEYLFNSFNDLISLSRSSYILLIFVSLVVGFFIHYQLLSLKVDKLNFLKLENKIYLSWLTNLLVLIFVGTIFIGLLYLFTSSYCLQYYQDENQRIILTQFVNQVGEVLVTTGLKIFFFLIPLTIRCLLLEDNFFQNYKYLVSFTGSFLILLLFFFNQITLIKFCYFLFFFLILLL